MLRFHNRILQLPDHRLPKVIYNWEVKEGSKCWVMQVKEICLALHLPLPADGVIYGMDNVNAAAYRYSRECWWKEALEMSSCVYTQK